MLCLFRACPSSTSSGLLTWLYVPPCSHPHACTHARTHVPLNLATLQSGTPLHYKLVPTPDAYTAKEEGLESLDALPSLTLRASAHDPRAWFAGKGPQESVRRWAGVRFSGRAWELQVDATLCPIMAIESPFKNDFEPGTKMLRIPLVEPEPTPGLAGGGDPTNRWQHRKRGVDRDRRYDIGDTPLPFGMNQEWFAVHSTPANIGNGAIFFQGACPNLPTLHRKDEGGGGGGSSSGSSNNSFSGCTTS